MNNIQQQEEIRKGIQTTISASNQSFEIGNFVQDVSVREYMRSRMIKFTAHGMKPSTRVYPFFDKTSVIANCTPDSGSLSGTNTTNNIPTEVAGNWAVVSKIQLKYDNNGTEDITAKIEASNTPNGFATTGTHSDLTSFTIAAGSNSTYNITLTSDRAPNSEGEQFFKFTFTNGTSGGTTATNRLYEIVFFDENDSTIITNATNSTVEDFQNFTNPANALLTRLTI